MQLALGVRTALLMATTGCNQVYGIERTESLPPVDAQYFDAPIDAPFACPALGAPPPTYSRTLRQIPQDCRDYTLSYATGIATAECSEPLRHLASGPIGELLSPIPGLTSMVGTGDVFQNPRVTPEGDELYYMRRKQNSTAMIERIRRSADGTWSAPTVLTPNVTVSSSLGTPSRGPTRRMMIRLGTGDIGEIEITSAGTWTTIDTYSSDQLGALYVSTPPSLSPDGLRLVWSGQELTSSSDKAFYATRSSLDARFMTYFVLQGVPGAMSPFMTDNCAHVYFYAASSILYVQQQ